MFKSICDRCNKLVDETTTSSCAIGGIEVSEYLENIDKPLLKKLCTFESHFFCTECMDGNICLDCSNVLSLDEKNLLKKLDKI